MTQAYKMRLALSLLLTVLLCLSPMGFGFSSLRTDTVEILEDQLKDVEGVNRIQVLIDLSEALSIDNKNQALSYAEEALIIADQLGEAEWIIDARNQMGYVYVEQENTAQALEAFQKSYEEALLMDYFKGAAFAQNGYGVVNSNIGEFGKAQEHYDKALELFDQAQYERGTAFTHNNRGATFEELGSFEKALEEYLLALAVYEAENMIDEQLVTYNNMGSVNFKLGNLQGALEYYEQALEISQSLNKQVQTANILMNIGVVYNRQDLIDQALVFYDEAYDIALATEATGLQSELLFNRASIYEQRDDFDAAFQNYGEALILFEELGDQKGVSSVFNNVGTAYARMGDYESAAREHENALQMAAGLNYPEVVLSAMGNLAQDYEALQQFDRAYYYMSLHNAYKDQLRDEDLERSFAESQTSYETGKKDQEIEAQKVELNLQSLRLQLITFILIIIAVGLISVAILSVWIFRERQKSEGLLLNILPKKVASDLKKTGTTEPERFQNVTVYFSDIVGFTSTSKDMDVKFLISELNDMFTTFDNIMEKYGCERIKTIGDAYLAVCGMPVAYEDHAERMLKASMELRNALEERNQTADQTWRIRIGLHSGTVVGGVVGLKKYIYDVFGDTINTASRMESNGAPMRINVSGDMQELLKDKYPFEERKPIEVKGKGKFPMYFLDHEPAWDIAALEPLPEVKVHE